jgi:alpha-tubulin suppressor-like RCC1 family protein
MLAAGAEHTIAVMESGKIYGWVDCRTLGLGNCSDHLVPGEVAAIAVRYSAHSQ